LGVQNLVETLEQRHRAVRLALALTRGTPLTPTRYERELLRQYEVGRLSIEQVLTLLEQYGEQKESGQ